MKGVAYPAFGPNVYNSAVSDWNLAHLVKPLGANWVRLHIMCHQETYTSLSITCQDGSGDRAAELAHATRTAHGLGLRVMWEYPLDLTNDPAHWAGDIGKGFTSAEQWAGWFAAYTAELVKMAGLAQANGVDALGIGQEISGTTGREAEWRALVAAVRAVYSGPLIYSSDQEADWLGITWWDAVDYIGIHPYDFQVAAGRNGTLETMKAFWKPKVARLGQLSRQWDRPVVITEIGYPSQDGISRGWNFWMQNWEVDTQESADLYQALIESFDGQPWFHGLFPYPIEAPHNPAEPLNIQLTIWPKPAYEVIRAYYGAPPLPTAAPQVKPEQFTHTLEIYTDRLGPGWSNYPPNGDASAIDLGQTQNAVAGSAIRVTVPAWTELIFNYDGTLDLAPYQWLEFDLYENEEPLSHPLQISLRDPDFASLPFTIEMPYSQYVEGGELKARTWQHVAIPLSAFGPALNPVHTLVISARNAAPITFYVDNVRLGGN